ncbi:serine/threonine-protein kinase [Methanobrevibacter arboriphilus]|uniref:serine/threonine-protein kinase n=1 Tax=Methanobrevibacter arboriphilus TaxID=39441 RepID=UPI0005B2E3EE|nr:serine/threonine-protein kinase [Methanobrevibacter arboriphilus]
MFNGRNIGNNLIEDFIILDIFEGGFGKVYICYSDSQDTFLAFKTFKNKNNLTYQKIKESFIKESEIAIELERHPNIVRVGGFVNINNKPFLAMEPILSNQEGKHTLKDFLKENLSLSQILDWSIQFCHGMEHINSKGIIAHRDIKPLNIMIGFNNILKIADFGLAKVTNSNNDNIKGTDKYMAPESFDGIANIQSDIYSFGIVMYEMLSNGKFPFDVDLTAPESLDWEKIHKNMKICEINSVLFTIIKKCLQKNHNERYSNFEELRKDLESLFSEISYEKIYSPEIIEIGAEEHMLKGQFFHDIKNYSKFILEYEKAIEKNPKAFIIRLNYGTSLITQGKYKKASKQLKKACIINPKSARVHFNLGHAYEWMELYDDAIFEYCIALNLNNEYPECYNNLGMVYMKTSKIDKAIKIYEKGLNKNPNFAMLLMNLGFAWHTKKQYKKAIDYYKKSEKFNDKNDHLYYIWGLTLQDMGQKSEAILKFINAKTLNPSNVEANIAFENSFSDKKQLKKSFKKYKELLEENSDNDLLKLNLGIVIYKQGFIEEGIEILDELIKSNSSISDQVWTNKGLLFKNKEDDENCIFCFNKALESNPKNISALHHKAKILFSLKMYNEAKNCHEKILNIYPFDTEALTQKAVCLAMLGRINEAEDYFIKAIDLEPKNVHIYLNKGAAYGNLGNHLLAMVCFEDALEIDGSNNDILLAKGKSHMNLFEYKEAISCFDKILKNKKSVEAHLYKTRSLSMLKRYDDALKELEKILKVDNEFKNAVESFKTIIYENMEKKSNLMVKFLF